MFAVEADRRQACMSVQRQYKLYSIGHSAVFNRRKSTYLSWYSNAQGNHRKFTVSFWLKAANVLANADNQMIFDYSNDYALWYITTTGRLQMRLARGYTYDTAGPVVESVHWRHYVMVIDTANTIAEDRFRMYIDGQRHTDWRTANLLPHNGNTLFNTAHTLAIGRSVHNRQYLDAYMADLVWLDGIVGAPTDFGEKMPHHGDVWVPKDPAGLDYSGVKSFWLPFESEATLNNDKSGKGHNFKKYNFASDATYCSTDSPTNNCMTYADGTLAKSVHLEDGNRRVISTGALTTGVQVMGGWEVPNGLWYWEHKITRTSAGKEGRAWFGLSVPGTDINRGHHDTSPGVTIVRGWAVTGSDAKDEWHAYSGMAPYKETVFNLPRPKAGMVIRFALNMSTRKCWVGVDGAWLGGGDPEAGTNPLWDDVVEPAVPSCGFRQASNWEYLLHANKDEFEHPMPKCFAPLQDVYRIWPYIYVPPVRTVTIDLPAGQGGTIDDAFLAAQGGNPRDNFIINVLPGVHPGVNITATIAYGWIRVQVQGELQGTGGTPTTINGGDAIHVARGHVQIHLLATAILRGGGGAGATIPAVSTPTGAAQERPFSPSDKIDYAHNRVMWAGTWHPIGRIYPNRYQYYPHKGGGGDDGVGRVPIRWAPPKKGGNGQGYQQARTAPAGGNAGGAWGAPGVGGINRHPHGAAGHAIGGNTFEYLADAGATLVGALAAHTVFTP